MKSKEAFTDQVQNIPDRKIKKKDSIEEISDEDATPKFERLTSNEEAILINVTKLPDEDEDMPPLVPDTEDEADESEGDLVTAYLQGETIETTFKPEKEEPLNQPIHIVSDIIIRAKTLISQSLVHKEEPKIEKTFEELVPKVYHQF